MACVCALVVQGLSLGAATPAEAAPLARFGSTLSGGLQFSTAVTSDGRLWALGLNNYSQLGQVAQGLYPPTQVPGLDQVTSVASGPKHTVALRADGTVWTFGANDRGESGFPASLHSPTPRQVPGLNSVTAVAAGGRTSPADTPAFSLAIRSDGTLWGFGDNCFGQLGPSAAGTCSLTESNPTPKRVDGLSQVTAVAAGWNFTIALRSDGTVWGFGNNRYGQLGSAANNGTELGNPVPTKVTGLSRIVAISAGATHSLAVRDDGTVWAFGDNTFGQLGSSANIGTAAANPTPVQVTGLGRVTSVAAGRGFSVALRSDGTVRAFGLNTFGQLGSATNAGTGTPNPTPLLVTSLNGVTEIAATEVSTVALKFDGTAWGFGNNFSHNLGPTNISGVNAVPFQISGLPTVAQPGARMSPAKATINGIDVGFAVNSQHEWGADCIVQDFVGGDTRRAIVGFSNGVQIVSGAMLLGWFANGGGPQFGCPISQEYSFAEGTRQDFVGGSLYASRTAGAARNMTACVYQVRWDKLDIHYSYAGLHRYAGNAQQAARNWTDLGTGLSVTSASATDAIDIEFVDYNLASLNYYASALVPPEWQITSRGIPPTLNVPVKIQIIVNQASMDQLDDAHRTYALAHEIGHALGLAHSDDCGITDPSIMKSGGNDVPSRRTLTPQWIDRVALEQLYNLPFK